tara:strand:+ start:1116 stop:4814 length:3699 start_codon:yes stop_codon:yes gene_type:complete
MSTLTNTEIRNTYDSLLKLADNGNLTTVLKEITDGLGNVTPLSISQIAIKSSVNVEASGFKTPTGLSSQFLKADGSLDSSDYALTSEIPTGNEIIDWTALSAGTIHITNLPATAITSVQIANSQVSMLALTAQEGDVVVRSDENQTYMHNGGTAGTIADFTLLATPTDAVSSVDGATGAVVLNHDTLAGFVDNEHIDWSLTNTSNIHPDNYTDTVYTHPANHSPSIITQDANNRFITDVQLSNIVANTNKLVPFTVTAGQVTIDRDLHVNGNITASADVIAYVSGAVSGSVLSLLTASAPLYKSSDTNVALRINATQFEVNVGNELQIKAGVLAPAAHTHLWADITDKPTTFAPAIHTHDYLPLAGGTLNGGGSNEVLKIEADANPYIRFVENGTNVGFLQFSSTGAYLSNQSNTALHIRTNNINRISITAGGSVSIGGTLGAANLSGTNTGDQDLSGYLLNTTDTFTGTHTGDTLYLGGSQITASAAVLQVNGFQRTGNVYIHEGGNSPTGTGIPLGNNSGNLQWNGYNVWTSANLTNNNQLSNGSSYLVDGSGGRTRIGQYALGSVSSGELEIRSDEATGWAPDDSLGRIRFYNVDTSGVGARDVAKIEVLCETGNDSSTTVVSGAMVFSTSPYNGNTIETLRLGSDQSATFASSVNATDGIFTGNVGIGTTSPDGAFQVKSSGLVIDQLNDFVVSSSVSRIFTTSGQVGGVRPSEGSHLVLQTRSTANRDIIFATGTTPKERVTIKGTGNVGIGTTSPQEPMHVYYADEANDFSGIRNTAYRPHLTLEDLSASALDWQIWADSNVLQFLTGDITTANKLTTERMRIDSSGNVGIGTTSPSQKLEVNDSSTPKIRFGRGTSYYWDIGHTSSDFQIQSQSGGTIMHLEFGGNVGIGTTSPNALLDVSSLEPRLRLTSTRTGVSSGQTAGAIDFYTSDGSSEGNAVNAKIEAYSTDIYGRLGLKFFTGGGGNPIESLIIDNSGNSTFASSVRATRLDLFGASGDVLKIKPSTDNTSASVFCVNAADTIVKWSIKNNGSANFSDAVFSGTVAATYYNVKSGDGNGVRFWSSESYKISMGNSSVYHYGTVPGYSIKTQMDTGSTDRGFTWGRLNTVPIASLNATSGNFQTAGYIVSGGEVTAYSDKRLKNVINTTSNVLDKLMKVNIVDYTRNDQDTEKIRTGVIAQELREVFPQYVKGDEDKEMLSVNYAEMVSVCIKAIQELKEEIKQLKNK